MKKAKLCGKNLMGSCDLAVRSTSAEKGLGRRREKEVWYRWLGHNIGGSAAMRKRSTSLDLMKSDIC